MVQQFRYGVLCIVSVFYQGIHPCIQLPEQVLRPRTGALLIEILDQFPAVFIQVVVSVPVRQVKAVDGTCYRQDTQIRIHQVFPSQLYTPALLLLVQVFRQKLFRGIQPKVSFLAEPYFNIDAQIQRAVAIRCHGIMVSLLDLFCCSLPVVAAIRDKCGCLKQGEIVLQIVLRVFQCILFSQCTQR